MCIRDRQKAASRCPPTVGEQKAACSMCAGLDVRCDVWPTLARMDAGGMGPRPARPRALQSWPTIQKPGIWGPY
eukprot:7026985-Prymnesium_polylepis.1